MDFPKIVNATSNYLTFTGDAVPTGLYTPSLTTQDSYVECKDNPRRMNFITAENPIAYAAIIKEEKTMAQNVSLRLVQVFIVDTDPRITPEQALLYEGERKLTNATDQELFFEVNIKSLLDKHNTYRKSVLDKKASDKAGKDIFLEEIRIRDLVMTVVELAKF